MKKQQLTHHEMKSVSGGGVGLINGAAKVTDGLFRVINASGHGVDGLTRPSPRPKNGNLCCSNSRRI
ncbi:hypothetical protein LYZ37_24015 (plasmid) [Vibrio tubiashii]|uniref:hypothetical protein n=1 Tax=Vibrio tubiashii TaxID=29498 RepID=UPI00234F1248|nr:hypothetical protein [Vibrio tubiashii]WCP70231.1 hypothetical protein LYZ37_24015 [Vibrio tubiashii]